MTIVVDLEGVGRHVLAISPHSDLDVGAGSHVAEHLLDAVLLHGRADLRALALDDQPGVGLGLLDGT
ncbi:Uncharacterised protein [Chlamydia trachomatis]|nr:Uncharacterised protein [Chlamydia trachomatis]